MGLLACFLKKSRAVLGLTGMELTFFTGAHLVLFWIYGRWFGCCQTAVVHCQAFLFFTPFRSCLLQWVGFRWARSWEGTQQLTGTDQRCSIPWHIMLGLKNKREEEALWGGRRSGWETIFQGGCCLETDWVWVCIWEVVRNCICITSCLSTPRTVFLSQLWVFLLGFYSLPCSDSWSVGVSKQLCDCLAAGQAKPTTWLLK